MSSLLSQVETVKPLPAFRKNSTMGTAFLASDGYVLEDHVQYVRISHPDTTRVARVPWAGLAFAFELDKVAPEALAVPASLGERVDPQAPAAVPVVRVGPSTRVDEVPAALRAPQDGSAPVVTHITAEHAAGMSASALEAAIADGAVVEAPPKKKGGWPAGKKRAKAAKDSSEGSAE